MIIDVSRNVIVYNNKEFYTYVNVKTIYMQSDSLQPVFLFKSNNEIQLRKY